jgi:hypothetical protein
MRLNGFIAKSETEKESRMTMIFRKGREKNLVVPACLAAFLIMSGSASPQRTASTVEPPRGVDKAFQPEIADPAYRSGQGPVILVDEAHNNFHTSVGLYFPFARVAEADGYVVERGREKITAALLRNCRIYVIADAQPPEKKGDPPTFSEEEVSVLNRWVRDGGALFLITDHMPDPSAVAALAASFGITINDGYAIKGPPPGPVEPLVFSRREGTLRDSPVTGAKDTPDSIESIATFAGSAFRADERFIPVLVFGPGVRTWMPEEYREFRPGTPNQDVEGWCQGGIMEYGKGRLAFFAEAAMFTAQVFDNGRLRVGMGHPQAGENMRLLRNVLHWLDGRALSRSGR